MQHQVARRVSTAIGVVTAALFLAPFAYLVVRSAAVDDTFAELTDASTLAPLGRSLLLAAIVTTVATVAGTALAWLTTRTDVRAARTLGLLVVLPLVVPSFIAAHAYVSAFAPGGLIESSLGVSVPEVRGLAGAVFVLAILGVPYVYLTVAPPLAALPPSTEEAARMLGLRHHEVLRRVVAPQLVRPLIGGATLVFLYTVSDFGAVDFVRYDTLTRKIYDNRLDPERSTLYSLLLGVIALGVSVSTALLARRFPAAVTGAARPPRVVRLGRARPLVTVLPWIYVTVAAAVPVGVMAWWVVRGRSAGARRSVAIDLGEAMWNSTSVSLLTAAAAVAVTLPVSWALARRPGTGATLGGVAVRAAFALPGIVVGLALVRALVSTSLYQTMGPLVLGYVLHFGGQAMTALVVAISAVPVRLGEAGRMLGVGRLRRLAAIDGRLMLPGVAAGAGLVMLSVLKELPTTLVLRPIGFDTLATRIHSTATEALLVDAGELSLVLIGMSAVLTWAVVIRPQVRRPQVRRPRR
jgi:iron(III) transport system permease protein